jgi:hypothetical protein
VSIQIIFSITVIFFIISAVALLATSAADMRRAATQKRLQTLRTGGSTGRQTVTEAARPTAVAVAEPYIALVPKHLRPDFKRMLESAGHAVSLPRLLIAAPIGAVLFGMFCKFFFHLGLFGTVFAGLIAGLLVPCKWSAWHWRK